MSFSASANVAGETGADSGAVLNAGGAPGVGGRCGAGSAARVAAGGAATEQPERRGDQELAACVHEAIQRNPSPATAGSS